MKVGKDEEKKKEEEVLPQERVHNALTHAKLQKQYRDAYERDPAVKNRLAAQ